MTTEQTAIEKRETARIPKSWEDSGVAKDTVGLARAMVASGYFQDVKDVAQAIVKIEIGKSLNISPILAMQHIHVIQAGGAKIQLGYPVVAKLIEDHPRYDIEVLEHTDEACAIRFWKDGKAKGVSRFSQDDAKKAGLSGDNWKKYPRNMLYARALTNGAKWYAAGALGGAAIEEPYIEAKGFVIESDDVPEEVNAPPEGYGNPWDRFWAQATQMGYDKAGVHAFYNLDTTDGALRQYVDSQLAQNPDMTEPEMLAGMLTQMEHYRKGALTGEIESAQASFE